MQKPFPTLISCALLLSLALVACGSNQKTSRTTPRNPSQTTPAITQPAVQSVQVGSLRLQLTGSEEKTYRGRSATILTFKDAKSGQNYYFESALRVALKAGIDANTFLNSYPALQLRSANDLYAEVQVAPEHITNAYTQVKQDARVKSVIFLPLSIPRTDRNNG